MYNRDDCSTTRINSNPLKIYQKDRNIDNGMNIKFIGFEKQAYT